MYEYRTSGDEIYDWEKLVDIKVPAATDSTQLEAQVSVEGLLESSSNGVINVYFMMTDWHDHKDSSEVSIVGERELGTGSRYYQGRDQTSFGIDDGLYSITVADIVNDGDMDIISDSAPSMINANAIDDLLRINVSHTELQDNESVELTIWRFEFFCSDGSTPLTSTEMTNSFSNYLIYIDTSPFNNNWEVTDSPVALGTANNNEVTFTFPDGESKFRISQGVSKTLFFVVQISSSPMVSSFRVKLNMDWGGVSDYAEIENNMTTKIISIHNTADTQIEPLHAPEYHNLFIPLILVIIIVIFSRKRGHKTGSLVRT
jgi:hypothetical protein